MSDILTRLLLNTSDYDSKLKKAKGSTQDFTNLLSSKMAGAAAKVAAGIGLAMGGVEAFNRTIHSSQTLGDEWDNTLSACKGTVDAFFQSLSTGNWGAFSGGLLTTLQTMKEVAALRDMLGDAKITLGFDTREFEREYVRLEGIIDDEKKSKGEREKAFAEMQSLIAEFRSRVEATGKGAAETLVKELNAKFGQDFTLEDVRKYIKEVNNEFLDTETLQRLRNYKAELAELRSQQYTTMSGGMAGTYTIENKGVTEQIAALKAQNSELEKMRVLQDDNDESRKNMVEQYEYVLEMQQKGDEFLKRSLEKQNKIAQLNKGSGTSGSSKKKAEFPVVVSQVSYDTPIGKKMLDAIEGKKFEPIVVPIVVDEEVQEEDLSGKWAEHLKRIEDVNGALTSTGEIFGNLGSIMSSFGNDMGAWMLGTVGNIAQMIVQLQSLATANGVASASKLPFPANLAAVATVVATIASVFSNLPKFADGGIVGGSSFYGDKLLARVNSGEMILNQGQQARALSLMESPNNVRVSGDVRLSGKDIYISLHNYLKSSGNKL